MRVGRGTLGPGAALLLVLVLASLDVAAPQYMSAGVEWKAGATIPSFAISGRDAVVAVHGQNFCPGGPRCEYCDFDPPQQLCGFSGDDDGVRFLMRYIDASHVACDVTAGESSKLRGFASASYSQNKGSDWTYLDRGDNLAIVNWANAPVTRRAIAPFAPAGMPVTLQGDEMVPDGDVARMGCAFDGLGAVDLSDSNQAQLSSTLTRCEVPSGVPSSAVIDVAVEPLGTAGSTPDGDKRAGASWVQVPWVIPSRVVSNSFAAAAGSEPATVEGGGGTFTAELSVWDTNPQGADGDARERLAAASAALGCRFGTIRVGGVRDVGAGVQSALRSNVAGAFECVAPALAPRAMVHAGPHARYPSRWARRTRRFRGWEEEEGDLSTTRPVWSSSRHSRGGRAARGSPRRVRHPRSSAAVDRPSRSWVRSRGRAGSRCGARPPDGVSIGIRERVLRYERVNTSSNASRMRIPAGVSTPSPCGPRPRLGLTGGDPGWLTARGHPTAPSSLSSGRNSRC